MQQIQKADRFYRTTLASGWSSGAITPHLEERGDAGLQSDLLTCTSG
jgi:hypothetical protein